MEACVFLQVTIHFPAKIRCIKNNKIRTLNTQLFSGIILTVDCKIESHSAISLQTHNLLKGGETERRDFLNEEYLSLL